MPVVFSGPGGRLVISVPQFSQKMRGLKTAVRKGAQSAGRVIAERHREAISTGIRSGSLGLRPLEPSTIRARLKGKPGGATPARPVKRGSKPLFNTGVSSGAIRVRMRSANVFEVSQPDGAHIGYSRAPMRKVSYYHEKGFRQRGKFTRAQLAYLHIMFRKGGKRAKDAQSRGGGKVKVGKAYSRFVGPRPAWANAQKKLAPTVQPTLNRHVRASIRASGLPVKF